MARATVAFSHADAVTQIETTYARVWTTATLSLTPSVVSFATNPLPDLSLVKPLAEVLPVLPPILNPQDGRVNQLEHVFIRGSKIRYLVIPDMLKNAPMFKRIDPRAGGRGGGRSGRDGGRGGRDGGRGGRGGHS